MSFVSVCYKTHVCPPVFYYFPQNWRHISLLPPYTDTFQRPLSDPSPSLMLWTIKCDIFYTKIVVEHTDIPQEIFSVRFVNLRHKSPTCAISPLFSIEAFIPLNATSYSLAEFFTFSAMTFRASHLIRGANSLFLPKISKSSLPAKPYFLLTSEDERDTVDIRVHS